VLLLLRALANHKEEFDKIRGVINMEGIERHDKEVLLSLEKYYEKATIPDMQEFKELFLGEKRHKKDAEVYSRILQNMMRPLEPGALSCMMNQIIQANVAQRITDKLYAYEAGEEIDIIQEMEDAITESKERRGDTESVEFAGFDELTEDSRENIKFPWHMGCLNEAMRPLEFGDDLVFAARPDQGKTTWQAGLAKCFAEHSHENEVIVWMNNEGPKKRVLKRVVQAVLGYTNEDIAQANKAGTLVQEYTTQLGRKDKIQIYDIHGWSTKDVEELLKKISKKDKIVLCIFDMVDNIRLSRARKENRTDENLEKLYIWARDLATIMNMVTVKSSQISASGDGDPWPQMAWLKDSQCFAKGTKIRRMDWSLSNIEDIKIGDTVMGIDGTGRQVTAISNDTEMMYEISSSDFSFVCNESHNLAVVNKQNRTRGGIRPGKAGVVPLREFLSKPTYRMLNPLRCVVESQEKEFKLEPYLLGLWLGDGKLDSLRITTGDKIIQEYLENHKLYGHTYKQQSDCVDVYLDNEYLIKMTEKEIPEEYKHGSIKQRRELLAGIMDSDGWIDNANVVTQGIVHKKLVKDIQEVAKSLGYKTTYREMLKKCQTGKFRACEVRFSTEKELPTKLHWKRYKSKLVRDSYKVKKLAVGEYYGITVDKDHKFCGEDFVALCNTGKQGATDTIIMMGHSLEEGMSKVRYFSAPKNKLRKTGAKDLKAQAVIDVDRARFKE
jgi:replicative DNA helicase